MKQYCLNCMEEMGEGQYCPSCGRLNQPDGFYHHLQPGTILRDKYLIGNCLGEGGFGITYIGRDLTLDIKVAVKEFFPNGFVNRNNTASQVVTATTEQQIEVFEHGKERFLQEARSLARFIGEPGIVDVREYFETNNTAYIIMEYLDGESLSSYYKRNGRIAPETVFRMFLPIVHSLQRIHQEGIIHRDISPENIMLLKKGNLVLMDFGSARFFTGAAKEMSVLLKKGYAPEEQYRKNGNQGPWSDVYSLCATMYRVITGRMPDDALDRLRQDALEPPSRLGVPISRAMESVLMYGLQVYQENRCHDMSELAALMQSALDDPDADEDVNRTQVIDGGLGVGAQIYAGGYQPPRQNNSPQQTRPTYADGYRNKMSAAEYQGPNAGRQPAPVSKNKTGGKTVMIVIVICALVIIGVTAGVIWALWPKDSGDTSSVSSISASTAAAADQDSGSDAAQNETKQQSADVIKAPDCVNKPYSQAFDDLIALGLTPKVTYEESDKIKKDYVIRQQPAAGSDLNSGDSVQLTVSSGAPQDPEEGYQKLRVTASSGSSYGTATLYQKTGGEWKKLASYDCRVGSAGIGEAEEGSSKTPQGTYDLGVLLTMQSFDTKYTKTLSVYADTVVVDDTSSALYNQIMRKSQVPGGVSTDDSIGKGLANGSWNAIIYIEHNGSGLSSDNVVKGRGSAIGLRGVTGSLDATYGDVDISASDMEDLLGRLDSAKHPVIEITTN